MAMVDRGSAAIRGPERSTLSRFLVTSIPQVSCGANDARRDGPVAFAIDRSPRELVNNSAIPLESGTRPQSRTAVSVVIPARNAASDLRLCLMALEQVTDDRDEVIVVDDASSDATADVAESYGARVIRLKKCMGPAHARNVGAFQARSDVIVFVDADVVIGRDTIRQLCACLQNGSDAVFGAYDTDPSAPNLVSQYKNLLHHFVHQHANRNASTFWAGCGAIDRKKFAAIGGFDEAYRRPSIEDIELGVRMKVAGYRIELDPDIQVTHLKRWTLAGLMRTDVFHRALPWTQLILEQRTMPSDLNLGITQKTSVMLTLACALFVVTMSLREPALLLLAIISGLIISFADLVGTTDARARAAERAAAVLLISVFVVLAWKLPGVGIAVSLTGLGILALNHRLFRFFVERHGTAFMVVSIPLHLLYYGYSGIAFGVGLVRYLVRQVWRQSGERRATMFASPQPQAAMSVGADSSQD